MSNEAAVFLVICKSGRPFGFTKEAELETLEEVLSAVYRSMQAGGSQYDHPNILMLNGKIIVEKNLSDIAWEYGKYKALKYDELYAATKRKAEDLVPQYLDPKENS